MLARGLTQGRSRTLGVVAFGLDYFGPTRILTGIERQAGEIGYSITLNLIHHPEMDDVEGLLNSVTALQADFAFVGFADTAAATSFRRPPPVLPSAGYSAIL